jgi:hypothetical protein
VPPCPFFHIAAIPRLKNFKRRVLLLMLVAVEIFGGFNSNKFLRNHFVVFPGSSEQYVWVFNGASVNDTGKAEILL